VNLWLKLPQLSESVIGNCKTFTNSVLLKLMPRVEVGQLADSVHTMIKGGKSIYNVKWFWGQQELGLAWGV
jgi:hypothetical protein